MTQHMSLQAPIIALYSNLNTPVPIYVAAALFIAAGCIAWLLPFEPRGKAAIWSFGIPLVYVIDIRIFKLNCGLLTETYTHTYPFQDSIRIWMRSRYATSSLQWYVVQPMWTYELTVETWRIEQIQLKKSDWLEIQMWWFVREELCLVTVSL